MGADSGNPRGYWEPRKALRLNYAILHRRGSGTYDPSLRLQEEGAFGADEKSACIAEIVSYLNTLPTAPVLIIKDLQITALSEMWFEAARLVGFDVAVVIAVRHPQEVVASLGGPHPGHARTRERAVAEVQPAGRETDARLATRVRRLRQRPR